MAVIPVFDNKNIETKDLEVHVAMCEYRRRLIEDKISNVEKDITVLNEQSALSRKLLLGAALSIITGVITTLVSLLINFNFFRS